MRSKVFRLLESMPDPGIHCGRVSQSMPSLIAILLLSSGLAAWAAPAMFSADM